MKKYVMKKEKERKDTSSKIKEVILEDKKKEWKTKECEVWMKKKERKGQERVNKIIEERKRERAKNE